MTAEDLKQLATRGDLERLENTLLERFKNIIKQSNLKEFYSPREFAEIVSMGYSNVVKYCQDGKIKARQDSSGGSWIIHRDEIERYVKQAENNLF